MLDGTNASEVGLLTKFEGLYISPKIYCRVTYHRRLGVLRVHCAWNSNLIGCEAQFLPKWKILCLDGLLDVGSNGMISPGNGSIGFSGTFPLEFNNLSIASTYQNPNQASWHQFRKHTLKWNQYYQFDDKWKGRSRVKSGNTLKLDEFFLD